MKIEESNSAGISKSGKRHVKPVDPDPHGEKLLQVIDIILSFILWNRYLIFQFVLLLILNVIG